jgi:hypothetical protein
MKKLMTLLISSGFLISLIFSGCSSLSVEADVVSTSSNIPVVESGNPVYTVLTTTVDTSTYTKFSTSTTSSEDLKEAPPVDWVTARTADGTGVITMVMRTYDNALTSEDIEYIREYTESLLETVYDPGYPKIVSSSPSDESLDARHVVYIYAVYSDKIPNSFTGTAGNENSCDVCYSHGMEWFAVELVERG